MDDFLNELKAALKATSDFYPESICGQSNWAAQNGYHIAREELLDYAEELAKKHKEKS